MTSIRMKKINKIIKEAQSKALLNKAREIVTKDKNDNLGEGDKFEQALLSLLEIDF